MKLLSKLVRKGGGGIFQDAENFENEQSLCHGVQEEKESVNALFVFQKVKEIYNT